MAGATISLEWPGGGYDWHVETPYDEIVAVLPQGNEHMQFRDRIPASHLVEVVGGGGAGGGGGGCGGISIPYAAGGDPLSTLEAIRVKLVEIEKQAERTAAALAKIRS